MRATGHRSRVVALAALWCAACAELPQAELEQLTQAEAQKPAQAEPAVKPAAPPAAPEPRKEAEATAAQATAAQATAAKATAAPEPPPAAAAAAPAAPPSPPPNIWHRVRAGFRLPSLDGALVKRQEQWYLDNPDYVARMAERSGLFLYHVMEEVERRKMPTEIALLPMVESAYNPQAYSRSHASGMWQFIPSTGKIYGLRQTFWYDGRRDVLAATGAALDYLQKLYDEFGDWTLALAAYNWGEGAVRRAIARNKAKGLPTGYESLPMPLETRNYLPKLQAVKNLVASPGQYGIVLPDIPNRPYFATVTTSRHIDVELAATFAEMDVEDFRFLNPAHNKPVIKSDGSESIVLPLDRVAIFQRNLESYDEPLVTWQTYKVKRSDKPESIAKKHGISLTKLKEANGITGRKRIIPGQTLLVPLKSGAEPHLPDLPAPKLSKTRHRRAACYIVSSTGAKKRVRCAPARKKARPAAVRSKPAAPSAGASIRALTGGLTP